MSTAGAAGRRGPLPGGWRLAIAFLVPFCLLAGGCARRAPVRAVAASRAPAPPAAKAVPVGVVTATRETLVDTGQVVGTLTAERRATLASQIDGRVVSVAAREGMRVEQGQVVVSLFDGDYRTRLAAAEAELRAARHRLGGAEADAEVTGTEVRVAEAQAAEQVRIAEAGLEQARQEVRTTRQRVEADVALAQAQLAAATARVRLLRAGARPQELARAKAEVAGARASLESAEEERALAERNWKRKSELLARGYVARQVVESAERDWQRASAEAAQAKAQLESLQEALKLLEAGSRPEELAQAEAEVRAAEERLAAAKADAGVLAQKEQAALAAEAELRRARELLTAARRGDARVRKSHQESQATRYAAELAEANVRLARGDLEKTSLRAPIAGVVSVRQVEPGETVQAGQPLLEILDPTSFYVEATALDRDVPRVSPGQPVTLRFDLLGGQTVPGRVREVLPPAGPQERGFRVKIALGTTDRRLRPGMSASGTIQAGSRPDVLAVPVAALLADEPEARAGEVWIVRDNVAHRRRLRLGARLGARVEVLSGLTEGELVVVEGQQLLKEGRPVRVQLAAGGAPR
ncbi:MAG: efflux RND transporter periplasmic adaptor subunit [Armatimonadetes bacterium]|nr:efflux RND transporter periplasmic adaptor subunit [Armatimonadota bacterium]